MTVGARAPAPVRLTLSLAGFRQEVTVNTQTREVGAGATTNADAVSVDQDMLERLPVLDQDVVASAARFLDAGVLGNGGVTLVVDGVAVNALRVSASAVQQIKVNQDPYSAEVFAPRSRAGVEILTKPASAQFHGQGDLLWRNAALDARNAFAPEKPTDRKHIVEGAFGGPAGHGGKVSFHLPEAIRPRTSRQSSTP